MAATTLTRPGISAESLQSVVGAAFHAATEEHHIASLVHHLFERAKEARRPLMPRWKENYHTLNNRSWTPGGESWMPAPHIAQIWPVIASLVAWMTDQRPTLEVTPSALPFSAYGDFYAMLGQHMNTALAATFSENALDKEISKSLWDVCTYGIGYTKTVWQPWLSDGIGDTIFVRDDPFAIYPDPFARDARGLNYIIEAKIMSMDDVDRAFPGAAKRIREGYLLDTDEAPHRLEHSAPSTQPRTNLGPIVSTGQFGSVAGSPAATRVWSGSNPAGRVGAGGITESPVVTVLECWVRTHRHLKEKDTNVSNNPSAVTRTVESWQCVVVCGNCVLLNESADQVSGFNTHPFDRLVLFDTGEWYGPCLVEFLASPQECINRILASVEHNLALMGNPVIRESPRSGTRGKRITNRPGTRLEGKSDDIGWLQPPQMAPAIASELIQYYESKIEAISGMSAIVRGFQPSGRNSTNVLDSVQDAAFVRVRATLREIEGCMKSVGLKMAANIAEFYTEPRLVSLMGPDGTRVSTALRSRHFYIPDDEKGDRIPMRFNLLADAGSQQATSRQARAAESERMFTMGIIDRVEALKAKQWPNWFNVARRVDEKEAQGLLAQQSARTKSGRSS